MRSMLLRATAVLAVVTLVAACDTLPACSTGTSCTSGGTPTPSAPDTTRPRLDSLVTPASLATLIAGQPISFSANVSDPGGALKEFHIVGLALDKNQVAGKARYTEQVIKLSGTGAAPKGIMTPVAPVDTNPGSLLVRAWVIDSAGNSSDTVEHTVALSTGPTITLAGLSGNDTIQPGKTLAFTVLGSDQRGLDSIGANVRGNWNSGTVLLDSIKGSGGAGNDSIRVRVTVPTSAPDKSIIYVYGRAVESGNFAPAKSATYSVYVCASCAPGLPRVSQTVPPLLEYPDTVIVSANSSAGVAWLGIQVVDSTFNLSDSTQNSVITWRDSVPADSAGISTFHYAFHIVPTAWTAANRLAQQGNKLRISGFARDVRDSIGYVSNSATAISNSPATAKYDTVRIAYGRTYPLPTTRNGTVGDLAVDAARGQVFLSNTAYNLLEVWNDASRTFASGGVQVGSRPWGLFIGNSPDTLLVANSGATTVSRVYINATTPGAAGIHEALAGRIRTRNSFVYSVVQNIGTTKISLALTGPYSYSDRPQYVAESEGGRLFFSTVPTKTAPDGTIRWLDPKYVAADARMIHSYAPLVSESGNSHTFAIFNADSAATVTPTVGGNDIIIICDHATNTADTTQYCASHTYPDSARYYLNVAMRAAGAPDTSDVEIVSRLDVTQLGLSDTTYAAASGDRTWIAFGEGNTTGAGRITMVNDPNPALTWPPFFSPLVTTQDLTENASEKVNGLALDLTGRQVASHGLQSYVAAVDNPYHLRLEGFYDSFDNGAGIAFHPSAADPATTPSAQRLAFAASSDAAGTGKVEAFDVAYYFNRGTYRTKYSLYGALRVSNKLAPDDASVVMKLYTLTPKGLLVIDLQSKDVKPAP